MKVAVAVVEVEGSGGVYSCNTRSGTQNFATYETYLSYSWEDDDVAMRKKHDVNKPALPNSVVLSKK